MQTVRQRVPVPVNQQLIKNRTLKCGFVFIGFKNYANFLICAANLDLWLAALLA